MLKRVGQKIIRESIRDDKAIIFHKSIKYVNCTRNFISNVSDISCRRGSSSSPSSLNLKKKVVVVTGGTGSIGKALCKQLACEGASVAVLSRNEGKVENLLAKVKEINPNLKHVGVACDVKRQESVQNAINYVFQEFEDVHSLVNLAGVVRSQLLLKMPENDIKDVLETNLLGTIFMCKSFIQALLKKKASEGIIINTGSVVGQDGNMGQTIYASSKAGLIGLTRSLAKEYGKKNLRVNLVVPGYIESDMTSGISFSQKETIKNATPLSKFGEPHDVTSMILFLLSSKASFITGQIIRVDGGLTL